MTSTMRTMAELEARKAAEKEGYELSIEED